MKKTLKWGIFSTARVCSRRFLPALAQSSRSELTGVASRDPERAKLYAEKCGIKNVYPSYEDLLNAKEIEAVYIPLPNSLHYRWSLAALRAGKHVLCEKPMALSAEEAGEMGAEAERKGLTLLEAAAFQFHPQTLKLVELIREGRIGRLRKIRARYTFLLPQDQANIRWEKELGGGALWDIGCYPVGFCRAATGTAPLEATAFQMKIEGGVDLFTAGCLRFPDDAIGVVECGFNLPYRVGAEAAGEKGTILVPNPWSPDLDGKPSGLVLLSPDDRETLIETEKINPYLCEIRAMEDAVLDGIHPAYTWRISRENIAAMETIERAAKRR